MTIFAFTFACLVAAYFQIVVHELSHGVALKLLGYINIKYWMYPHQFHPIGFPVIPFWEADFWKFKLNKSRGLRILWARIHASDPSNKLDDMWSHIAPMIAGGLVMLIFGMLSFVLPLTFTIPFVIFGLLHVLDFWKDYLIGKEYTDGKKFRYGPSGRSAENGDHSDHRLKNLRFLCPNCHQQTRICENKGPIGELVYPTGLGPVSSDVLVRVQVGSQEPKLIGDCIAQCLECVKQGKDGYTCTCGKNAFVMDYALIQETKKKARMEK